MDEEAAKAVKEIAKTSAKALAVAEKLGCFFNKVLGDAASEIGGAVHDWVVLFRYKNLLRLQDKVEAIHQERQLQGKSIPIPPRFAIPLLQQASQEDDESVQDMWAGLIANAMDPNRQFEPKKIFTEILSSFEPIDAKILRHLLNQGWPMHRDVPDGGITMIKIQSALGDREDDIRLSLQNLHRLGCLINEYEPTWDQVGTTSFGQRIVDPKTTFRPSPLGFALLKACEKSMPGVPKQLKGPGLN